MEGGSTGASDGVLDGTSAVNSPSTSSAVSKSGSFVNFSLIDSSLVRVKSISRISDNSADLFFDCHDPESELGSSICKSARLYSDSSLFCFGYLHVRMILLTE